MTIRRLFPLFAFAALAGCEVGPEGAPPAPPEDVAEATPPDASGRDPKGPDTYQVSFDTTEGEVVIDVERALSPLGADRFYRLVKEGVLDEAKFFRVVPGFVAQIGMAANPAVNAKWQDANIRDEPVKTPNTKGTVTFAKTQLPNTRSSQIFINLEDNSGSLDPQGFSPFGRVTKGMEAVERLHSGYGDRPDQQAIAARGNAYLDAEFPELDAVKAARVISENGKPVGEAAAAPPAQSEAAAGAAGNEAETETPAAAGG